VSGRLTVIGLGPGDSALLTPQAQAALAEADALYGYGPYLDRVPARDGQSRHVSDNREEGARAAAALAHAAAGANVAVVSGGDPGVFAMATAVCEQIEAGPAAWRALDVRVVPGITAMLAVAARVGAPLGHDFCALSLSDNLKPWEAIERRLDAAASAGFVIALYNAASRARPWQIGVALERLRRHLPATTPVVFGRAVSRPDERITVTTLTDADPAGIDMATLIIVGSAETRTVGRPGLPPLVYSPRGQSQPGRADSIPESSA
jgi:precorrin-3B C17-methyltransferase